MDRKFLMCLLTTALLFTAPFVQAQQAKRVPKIGMLSLSPSGRDSWFEVVRQGLHDLGYVEGQNIVIVYKSAEGRVERLPDLAAELVRLKVDIIVARATPVVQAANNATSTIPIGISAADPVGSEFVASRARTSWGRPPLCRSLRASGWKD